MRNSVFNSSINFNNSNNQLLLKTWMNIWTLFNTILATIVSLFIILYVIILYISKKKSKKSFHVSLVLTCNTCLTIICSGITFSLMTLASIAGDHNIVSLERIICWGCYIRGYLTYAFFTSIYLSYVLQAGYRLLRIVYHKYKYLRALSTFSYYILAQWILSFTLTLPILIGSNNFSSLITYLPENFTCLVPFTSIRGAVFLMLTVYLLPVSGLWLIYSRIIIHIRRKRERHVSTLKLRRHNKRDTTVIKRIYTVILILLVLGFPAVLFLIAFIITGNLHWTAYRISCVTISTSFVFISLSSLYVTPQIYKKIRIICDYSKLHEKHHRVSYSININIERERKSESILLSSIQTY